MPDRADLWDAAGSPAARGSRDVTPDVPKLRDAVQRAMTAGAGVVRSESSLAVARAVVADVAVALGDRAASVEAGELGNLLQLAAALLASADSRTESRGAHSRQEFPESQASWRRRQVHGTTRT
jgi:succinate dehydrogenase/fumarate reductase flavoprotein subunit